VTPPATNEFRHCATQPSERAFKSYALPGRLLSRNVIACLGMSECVGQIAARPTTQGGLKSRPESGIGKRLRSPARHKNSPVAGW
jgi:hypothetical protein